MKIKETIYENSPVWLQNSVVAAYGYYWKKRRFSNLFEEEYFKAREREGFSLAEWQEYVQLQIRRLMLHAFNTVPFYHDRFLRSGFNETKLKTITVDRLSQLPVLQKDDFRKNGTTTMLSSNLQPNGIYLKSSGSSGTPTQTRFSHAMHQRWYALMESRVRNWAGVSSNIPRGMIGGRKIMAGSNQKQPFYRYNPFEKQTYFSAFHISEKNASSYLEGMKKHLVEYMTGYAMSNYFLATNLQQCGLTAPPMKAVITSSENLTAEMRNLLERTYDCKVFNSWSGIEACGLVSECKAGNLHIHLDAGWIELLDRDLYPVKSGQPGDVYCTGFLNYDQPLIRYKIGDQMVFSDESCKCGSQLPVVKEIIGRCEDVVYGKDGRKMVRFHNVFKSTPVIQKAQVFQDSLDYIVLKIISDRPLRRQEVEVLNRKIHTQLGKIEVRIERVNEIPLTANGKFKAVVSTITF